MLGCIGVAPAGDFAPTSGPSGSYGGNLDYNKIGEGATVYLPVYHPGGLLFVGDGHALQADGEPTGTGIETSMDVEFVVELKKAAKLTGPRVETADEIISIGSQPEFASALDNGLKMATSDMAAWLAKDYGMEPWAAHLLDRLPGALRRRHRRRLDGPLPAEGSAAEEGRRPPPRRHRGDGEARRRRSARSPRRRKACARSMGSSRSTGTRPQGKLWMEVSRFDKEFLVSGCAGERAGVEPGRARPRAARRLAGGRRSAGSGRKSCWSSRTTSTGRSPIGRPSGGRSTSRSRSRCTGASRSRPRRKARCSSTRPPSSSATPTAWPIGCRRTEARRLPARRIAQRAGDRPDQGVPEEHRGRGDLDVRHRRRDRPARRRDGTVAPPR